MDRRLTRPPEEPPPPWTGREPLGITVDSEGTKLSALLFLPAGRPRGALLVCHGAGSQKENHAIMAHQAAERGLAALVFDFRGHGESGGVMDERGWHDVVVAGEELLRRSAAPWLAGRGSSMGGLWLLLAARARPGLFRSLVLLCPADAGTMVAGLRRLEAGLAAGDPEARRYGRFDVAALLPYMAQLDLVATARGMRRVLIAHARDDDSVPFAHSERLAAALAPPSRFMALETGGHKAPARSAEVARATLEWALARG